MQHIMSIFGLREKYLENMLKRGRMLLCVADGGRGEYAGPRVLTAGVLSSPVLRYGRLKIVEQRIDFWRSYKIGRNDC